MSTLHQSPSVRKAFMIGAALVMLAFALAEFVTFPANGHRIDTTKWPVEAQAILQESPGTPISSEQWKRIDGVLRSTGGMNYGQRPYWAETVRASWWWFVFLPLLAVLVAKVRRGGLNARSAIPIVAPSLAFLVLSLALTGGAA